MLMALRSWDKFISAAAAPFLLFDRRKPVLSLPKKKKRKRTTTDSCQSVLAVFVMRDGIPEECAGDIVRWDGNSSFRD